jgi:endoribonuclease Nob1
MVLDTSAFVAGFDPFSVSEEQFATPMVEEEIKAKNLTTLRFNTAIESGRLKISEPSQEFLNKAKASATALGDSLVLSKTDIEILALALQLKAEGSNPQIVTDDYAIQNVAAQLGLGFVSLATFGIRRVLNWIRYCPACHREYPANYKSKECSICGTELKRKPQRTQNAAVRKATVGKENLRLCPQVVLS